MLVLFHVHVNAKHIQIRKHDIFFAFLLFLAHHRGRTEWRYPCPLQDPCWWLVV